MCDEHTRETVNIAFGRGDPARDRVAEKRDVKPANVSPTLRLMIVRWLRRQLGVAP